MRTLTLIVIGSALVIGGLSLLYIKRELASPDALAERVLDAASQPEIRAALGDQVTGGLLGRAASQMPATHGAIDAAIAASIASPEVKSAVRAAMAESKQRLVKGDGAARIDLSAAGGEVARQVGRELPQIRAFIPSKLDFMVIDLAADEPLVQTVRRGNWLMLLAWPLLIAGVAALALATLLARHRHRVIVGSGLLMTLLALGGALSAYLGRSFVSDSVESITTVGSAQTNEVMRAIIFDLLGSFETWMVITAVSGTMLAGLALLGHALLPPRSPRPYEQLPLLQ